MGGQCPSQAPISVFDGALPPPATVSTVCTRAPSVRGCADTGALRWDHPQSAPGWPGSPGKDDNSTTGRSRAAKGSAFSSARENRPISVSHRALADPFSGETARPAAAGRRAWLLCRFWPGRPGAGTGSIDRAGHRGSGISTRPRPGWAEGTLRKAWPRQPGRRNFSAISPAAPELLPAAGQSARPPARASTAAGLYPSEFS